MIAQLLRHQVMRFGAVGAAAAATHLLVVAAVVPSLHWTPLAANLLGFLVAFWVSYGGHRWLTFATQQAPHRQALPRFFLVACAGFVANEGLYALALHWLPWHYLISLVLVLVAVAVGTFVASKCWAFAASKP